MLQITPIAKPFHLLSQEMSDFIGKNLIWYWIKRLGKLLEIREKIRTQDILNNPQLPSKSKHLKATIKIDATSIHKQYRGRPTRENLEVKLGICYIRNKEKEQ